MKDMATRIYEIFRPGNWNGYHFGDHDLIDMVNNSNAARHEFRALISLNHEEVAPEIIREASFGMAARYFLQKAKDGVKSVFAEVQNIPDSLIPLLDAHYPNRSVDLFFRYPTQGGRVLRNVIAGISFLGAKMPPAVKGMFPKELLHPFHDGRLSPDIVTITFSHQEENKPMPNTQLLSAKRAADGKTLAEISEASGIDAVILDKLESGDILPNDDLRGRVLSAYGFIDGEPTPWEREADTPSASLDISVVPQQDRPQETPAENAPELPEPPTIVDADAVSPMETAITDTPDMIAMRDEISALRNELQQAREDKAAEKLAHFFETLAVKHHASQILTGQHIQQFAQKLSHSGKVQFAEGRTHSLRDEFCHLLQGFAEQGVGAVPMGQIAEPKARFADNVTEARHLIEERIKTDNIPYLQARLAVKGERPELFREED
jgi:hypothetical protein